MAPAAATAAPRRPCHIYCGSVVRQHDSWRSAARLCPQFWEAVRRWPCIVCVFVSCPSGLATWSADARAAFPVLWCTTHAACAFCLVGRFGRQQCGCSCKLATGGPPSGGALPRRMGQDGRQGALSRPGQGHRGPRIEGGHVTCFVSSAQLNKAGSLGSTLTRVNTRTDGGR